jgi:DNA (cytosine-5)-methyltransferase 1
LGNLTLLSLFDGSGGFPLAAQRFGIEPVAASEIEPFPLLVTRKNFPGMKHYGDINKINGAAIEPVDIISAGFCCQDLSISGRRAGLAGERSGLFFQVIRIIKEMQEATNYDYPKAVVLENVMGLLSSSQGHDFITVMDELFKLGFYVDANCLDAQEFGVAQRRKRVFICAVNPFYYPATLNHQTVRHPAMTRALKRLPADAPVVGGIVSRAHPPVRVRLADILEPIVSADYLLSAKSCAGILDRFALKGKLLPPPVQAALEFQSGRPVTVEGWLSEPCAIDFHQQDNRVKLCGERTTTLTARAGTGGNNVPLLCYGIGNGQVNQSLSTEVTGALNCMHDQQAVAFCLSGNMIGREAHNGPNGDGVNEDVAFTLTCADKHCVVVDAHHASVGDISGTLRAKPNGGWSLWSTNPVAVYPINPVIADRRTEPPGHTSLGVGGPEDAAFAMLAAHRPVVGIDGGCRSIVRRLTELECSRLMGFPDDWCAGLSNADPSAEELAFWRGAFEEHRRLISHAGKPKTEGQIRKWLADPYTASAQYKMWGNGLVKQCAEFVFEGLAPLLV